MRLRVYKIVYRKCERISKHETKTRVSFLLYIYIQY